NTVELSRGIGRVERVRSAANRERRAEQVDPVRAARDEVRRECDRLLLRNLERRGGQRQIGILEELSPVRGSRDRGPTIARDEADARRRRVAAKGGDLIGNVRLRQTCARRNVGGRPGSVRKNRERVAARRYAVAPQCQTAKRQVERLLNIG